MNVLRHDGHSLGVNGAQVGVLEEADEVRLGRLLQREHRRGLESQVRLEVLRDFSHEALERELTNQKFRGLLVLAAFVESARATGQSSPLGFARSFPRANPPSPGARATSSRPLLELVRRTEFPAKRPYPGGIGAASSPLRARRTHRSPVSLAILDTAGTSRDLSLSLARVRTHRPWSARTFSRLSSRVVSAGPCRRCSYAPSASCAPCPSESQSAGSRPTARAKKLAPGPTIRAARPRTRAREETARRHPRRHPEARRSSRRRTPRRIRRRRRRRARA